MNIFDRLKLNSSDVVEAMGREMQMLLEGRSDSITHLKSLVEANPGDAENWFDLAQRYIDEGLRYEDLAMERARLQYAADHPDAAEDEEVELHVELPEKDQFFEHALEALDHLLTIAPEYYGVQVNRGIAFANMRKYEEAEKALLQALVDDDEDFNAASTLSMLYHDMGNEEKAHEYHMLYHKLNPLECDCECENH